MDSCFLDLCCLNIGFIVLRVLVVIVPTQSKAIESYLQSLNVQKFLYKVYSSYREKLGRGRVMVTAWQSTPPTRRTQWVVL